MEELLLSIIYLKHGQNDKTVNALSKLLSSHWQGQGHRWVVHEPKSTIKKGQRDKSTFPKEESSEVTFKICALSWSDNLWLKTGS